VFPNRNGLSAEIDGRPVDFRDKRFTTGLFVVNFPAGAVFGIPGPLVVPDNIADAYALMLEPPSVGRHVLHVRGASTGYPIFWDLTMYLTVLPAGRD
jgi:hypothetical protein